MKLRNLVLLATLASFPLFAQTPATQSAATTAIVVSELSHLKLENSQLKVQNIQLQAQVVQLQSQAALAQLQGSFSTETASFNSVLEQTKKDLNLPPEAVLDPKTLTLSVPPKTVIPVPVPTAKKK